jgi:hypothetical protein
MGGLQRWQKAIQSGNYNFENTRHGTTLQWGK